MILSKQKRIIIGVGIVICLLLPSVWREYKASQGIFQKKSNETVREFVDRVKPKLAKASVEPLPQEEGVGVSYSSPKLIKDPVEGVWNGVPVIIAPYTIEMTEKMIDRGRVDIQVNTILDVYLYVALREPNQYRRVFVVTKLPEGGDAHLEKAFFANADQDPQEEMILLTSWPQHHYDVNGTMYEVSQYDNMSDTATGGLVGKDFTSECDCTTRTGEVNVASLKTETAIREFFKKLGY